MISAAKVQLSERNTKRKGNYFVHIEYGRVRVFLANNRENLPQIREKAFVEI